MSKSIFFAALLSFVAASSTAQTVAQMLSVSPRIASSAKFRIPIIALKDASSITPSEKSLNISQRINEQILAQVTQHLESISVPLISNTSLQYMVDNLAILANIAPTQGVQGIDYKVIYNKGNQIVLNITFKHDAKMSETCEYELAFDLNTGKKIALTDIADMAELTNIDLFTPTQTGSLSNRLGMLTSIGKMANNATAFAKLNSAKHRKSQRNNAILATY